MAFSPLLGRPPRLCHGRTVWHANFGRHGRSPMQMKQIVKRARKLAAPYRIDRGKGFALRKVDPNDTGSQKEDKPRAKEMLATGIEALRTLQDKLYAEDRWAVLLIFQAMDAAGKDGA